MISSQKILIVEDDLLLLKTLENHMRSDYAISRARSGKYALRLLKDNRYSCIILDLYLSDYTGTEIINLLRSNSDDTPIIIISGESMTDKKVELLDSGANDFLTKPFDIKELQARVRALTRKKRTSKFYQITCDDLIIDTKTKHVIRDGVEIILRNKEYGILECLAYNAGNVVPRDALLDYAWDPGHDSWTSTVNVHINALRRKIDEPFSKSLISTARGHGYKLNCGVSVVEI